MKTSQLRRKNHRPVRPVTPGMTLGDIIATAYDRLGSTRLVVSALRHTHLASRNGRRLVFP